MKTIISAIAMASLIMGASGNLFAEDNHAAQKHEKATVKKQTTCPVMGGKINKKLFADVKGKRIYTCCPMCIKKVKKDPEKYIKKLEDSGVTLDKTPQKEHSAHQKKEDEHKGHNH